MRAFGSDNNNNNNNNSNLRFVLVCVLVASSTQAFAPNHGCTSKRFPSTTTTATTARTTTQHRALPIEHLAATWEQIQQSATQFIAVDDVTSTATTTITAVDAMTSAAVAAATTIPASQEVGTTAATGQATGLWGSYINLFKSTLLWLHGTIDGPLRSVGFEQTWGVSIGLFTLCKYACFLAVRVNSKFSSFCHANAG